MLWWGVLQGFDHHSCVIPISSFTLTFVKIHAVQRNDSTDTQIFEEIPFYFIIVFRVPFGQNPINSSPYLVYEHIDIAFSWLDVANELYDWCNNSKKATSIFFLFFLHCLCLCLCVVLPWYNYTYTYTCRNIINNNDERTHFLIKTYLSHFMLERVAKGLILVMCEWWVGDGADCHILTTSSSAL